jgi:signal transduction histidine kinase
MPKRSMIGVLAAAVLTLGAATAFGQKPEFGTAAEAKALLERAIPLVKADKKAAFAKFLSGEDNFKDRDLYVFCLNSADGIINAAPPAVLGKACATIVDKAGDKFCQRIWDTAKEGTISEVSYMFPRPGSDTPVKKISYVTKVADQVCGVGYYPPQ